MLRIDPCHEELYDLDADPLEHVNLLAYPLAPDALAAHEQLAGVLQSMQ